MGPEKRLEETQEDKLKILEYEYYRKERESALKAEQISISSFEKTITSLAAGALALSIAFVKDISPEPIFQILLLLAWVSFGLSLLIILVGFLLTQKAFRMYLGSLDEELRGEVNDSYLRWGKLTDICNVASLISLIIGIVFLTYFTYINLPTP